jgi:thiamine biosynthesis lipoprotein
MTIALAVAMAGARAHPQERPAEPSVLVEREAFLMGTWLRVQVAAPNRELGVAAIEAAFAEVARLESLLSSWRSDSEVSRLNRSVPGIPVRVEREVFDLLAEVWEWARASDGAFDPAVGPLIEAWDLRGRGRRPSAGELEQARRLSGLGSSARVRRSALPGVSWWPMGSDLRCWISVVSCWPSAHHPGGTAGGLR